MTKPSHSALSEYFVLGSLPSSSPYFFVRDSVHQWWAAFGFLLRDSRSFVLFLLFMCVCFWFVCSARLSWRHWAFQSTLNFSVVSYGFYCRATGQSCQYNCSVLCFTACFLFFSFLNTVAAVPIWALTSFSQLLLRDMYSCPAGVVNHLHCSTLLSHFMHWKPSPCICLGLYNYRPGLPAMLAKNHEVLQKYWIFYQIRLSWLTDDF